MKIPPKSKKAMPPPPAVASLINSLLQLSDDELVTTLQGINTWEWPRTDLNAWIKVLNRFDDIMDSIIREYDVENLQLRPFSQTTKELLSQILRFERLLLEYSTNRKTFSSYDHLNNLLSSADLEIVILALNVLLRPSQQYSSQQPVSHLSISTTRLQSLVKRWSYLRENGIGLLELVSDNNEDLDTLPPAAREVNFTFYNTEVNPTADKKVEDNPTGSPRKVSSDAVHIRLDEQTITSQPVMNVLADAIKCYSIPGTETFELLCRIRAATCLASGKKVDRENLLIIRLLAIAIFGHTHSESQATSALFLYEPDLIAHIAELLQSDKSVPIPVQTAAIAALDALARYKGRVQEVLTAVNAGVNHGVLLALVRNMVVEVANPESKLPHSFIEALLSFITYLASHAVGGNMVVSAGLIPLLVQIVENKNLTRLPVVSKTMQLLDNVIYSFQNAFSLFCASRGVEILVERIEYEVDNDVKDYAKSHQPYALSGLGELPIRHVAVLKHMLRSMHRMMQSSGTAEGLRNLIDMSLLKSIKKIVEYRGLFGPSVFPLAINIMSSFVHNEPTSLAIIQESGLPGMFYQAVECGIEPAIEVIQAIPNAIGALCLNEVGQAQLANHPSVIPSIISIFTSERHLKVVIDKENAVIIGTAVDELIRHHPSLRQSVFEALESTLGHLENLGMAYKPPDDIKRWYQLIPLPQVHTTGPDITMQDSTSPPRDVEQSLGDAIQCDDQEDTDTHVNTVVSYIDVLGRFLDGFFQHPVHCRDFVQHTDGLERIGRLTALPCLPFDFANNVASDSMVQVLRTMAEVATRDTLSKLIEFVKQSLTDTKFLWDSEEGSSKLLPFVDLSEGVEVTINQQFRNLVTLYIRITLLSDVFATVGQPQSRATITLWQTLMNSIPHPVLASLGALHRASAWESSVFAAGLKGKDIEIPDLSFVGLDEGVPSLVQAIPSFVEAGSPAPASSAAIERNASPDVSSSVNSRDLAAKSGGPQDWNAAALTRIIQAIPNTLAPFFQAIVKMFHSRRNTDMDHKKLVFETSKVVANIMLKHLSIPDHEEKTASLNYYSLLLNLVGRLLIDDRTAASTLHTVQVYSFYQVGGVDSFFDIFGPLVSNIDELIQVSEDARTASMKKQLLQVYAIMELMLQLVHPLISAKTIFDSAQTVVVMTRDKRENDLDYFEPHNFLVKIRFAALPIVKRLWESPWLSDAPVNVSRCVVRCMLEIMNAENEDGKSDPHDGGPSTPLLARAGLSETQVQLLMDMGFPRSAVERALAHANNDVNSATEYLLSLPFPLLPDPDPAALQTDGIMDDAMTTEETPEASEPNTDVNDTPPPPIVDEEPNLSAPQGKSSDEWRQLLDEAREPLKVNISKRSLSLIDQHLSLLFDLHVVFTKASKHQEQAVGNLVDDISAFSAYAYDVQEQPLANRCRLLALVLCERPSSLEPDLRNTLMDRLLVLLLTKREPEHPPKWLAAHLLVTEALFTLADEPRTISAPKEGETVESGPIPVGPARPEVRSIVFDFCLQLLSNDDLPADEFLSVLRLFVLLTRDRQMAIKFVDNDGISSLFRRLRKSAVTGGSSYVASILRHVVEDIPIIRGIMQQTIRGYFSQARRIVDLPTYIKNCSAIALRDTDLFINTTNELCLVENPYSSPHIKVRPAVQPADKTAVNVESSTHMQIDPPQASSLSSIPNKSVEAVIHLLINEVMNTAKSINETPSPKLDPESSSVKRDTDIDAVTSSGQETGDQFSPPIDSQDGHQYLCFVMQCLTELLFSYDSCKIAFLSYSKKRPQQTHAKEQNSKFRTTTLHFLLSDIITYSTINPASDPKYRSRAALCSWAMNVVGALCVDTSATQETKEVSSDLLLVRKFVLETINRAIKEIWTTLENTEARYGRLLALADLCHRLLTVRTHPNSRKQQQDEVPTHLAKIMLEKNFVSTLTNALSEVDLNYPNVRNLVASVLRPLEHLSKVAIKMTKATGRNKEEVAQEEAQSSASEDEDEDMDDASPREETPDLYRHSALGMYGGEMDDRPYTDDEEMDDDDGDQNVEMEYGDGTGSEATSASGESDEDEMEENSPVSPGSWNEDEEDEGDLVRNRDEDEEEEAEHEGDEDHDHEDNEVDDEEDEAGIIWEDVQRPEALGMILENADEEQGLGVSIQINHEDDDPDIASDEEELLGQAHLNNDEMIELGNAVMNAANQGPGLFIQRRFPRNFGRSRNLSAPETITHPLLLDVSTQSRSNIANPNRNLRNSQRFVSNGPPPSFLQALDQVFGEGSLQAIQHFVHQGAGFGGMFHIQLGTLMSQPRRFLPGSARQERSPRTNGHRQGREFDPLHTIQRWAEEMRILHGDFVHERANKVTNHLMVAMLPAALEAQKQAQLNAQQAAKRKEEEEREKKSREAEEEAKRSKTPEEDPHRNVDENASDSIPEESRTIPATTAASTEQTEPVVIENMEDVEQDAIMADPGPSPVNQDSEMTGVMESSPASEQTQSQSSSLATNREVRITIMIHGSAVDITDTGIDPSFLEALPDDMREEVLNQHIRDQQAARVERPPDSLISAEFLDALPPDIRAEIIQQEAMERTRRRTEEGAPRPAGREAAEIDAASFIASLDPSLRQAVLLDQDDTFLRTLPPHMIAEAGTYRDEAHTRRSHGSRNPVRSIPAVPLPKKHTQHDARMLLDRAGVAILVRLLFYPQVLKKGLLFKVLVNLCENAKTRIELFNILLSILQDGTGDLTAVDKSFSQMTVKSREVKGQTPKGKQKSTEFGTQTSQMEAVPDLIAQRCLEALAYIVNANESSSLFFLTEQEINSGPRKPSTKKGKGKEKQISQAQFPLVLLLSLLDRQTLLRTPAILESVVGLLATITRPLTGLKEPSKSNDQSTLPTQENEVNDTQSTRQLEEGSDNLATAPPEEPTVSSSELQSTSDNKVNDTEPKNVLIHPPHVSDSALRLIVNILTIGECSSRTFQQSLALIQNLSYIPDARDVIASELKMKAQDCGKILYTDLDELAVALQESKNQTIASSVAGKFSPASSTQAKLLRVLKTIDYMYSPKPTAAVGIPTPKEDVDKVQAIYESFRFTNLWRRLGDCLLSIGENSETEHIAMVLLPLIESLMVVCKFVGAKNPIPRALRITASPMSPTTSIESMEELFNAFTDAHRKILNVMVRNNPSLMSGSFSLLINNSRVLDFDNKRNYFNQQLHRRSLREHYGTLQLNVRRARVFEDSFLYLQRKTGEQMKYGKLSVRFYDEEGVDAGGLTREWFQILARQMFNPNYALFQPCAADKLTYQPNKASSVNPEHLSFFKFVGRVIGKAIYDGRLLDAYFARSLYRQILGKPVDYKDVEWIDPEYYKSLCWILENDPTSLDLTFSIEADEFGVNKIVPLKEKGETTPVTQENRREYVQLSAQYRLYSSIKDQIEGLLGGFYEIIPKDLITIFNEQELELLISGTPDIDVDEWRAATEYNGYGSSDPNIVWWWRALKSFNREERAKVLSFATGTSRVPLNGFLDLQGVQGVQKFSIHRAYGEPDRLPQAHTCFNQIDLPQYTSYEMLRQQILLAINEGGEGFGFS